jgi:hypothetical protein
VSDNQKSLALSLRDRTGDNKMMKTSRIEFFSILLLGTLILLSVMRVATAQEVGREQDIVNLRLGQRIKVDDGTCPAGQIKEVSGSKMTSTGVERTRKCIPRLGPKTK